MGLLYQLQKFELRVRWSEEPGVRETKGFWGELLIINFKQKDSVLITKDFKTSD